MAEKRASMVQTGPGSMGTGEQSKDLKKAFGDFFRYIGRYKAPLMAAVLLSLAGAVLTLIGPGWLGEVTNLIQEGLSGAWISPPLSASRRCWRCCMGWRSWSTMSRAS